MPKDSNNPFGIKSAPGQPYSEAITHEVVKGVRQKTTAKFRKFDSLNESFQQHAALLANSSHYKLARSYLPDADRFADGLTNVYATDPDYGTKLKKTMKSHNLYQ